MTYPPIGFIENEAIKEVVENEQEISEEMEIKRKNRKGKYSWIDVPEITSDWKKWSDERSILVSKGDRTYISLVYWEESQDLPEVSVGGSLRVKFTWDSIYRAIKYGSILSYERDSLD